MELEEICLPIKSDLQAVEQVIERNLISSVAFVTDVATYVIKNGGKRLRPMLTLFSSRLAGGAGPKAVDCATAMEFFHTATLMHDDVIDNADTRRGKPSAKARWGNHASVLVGDFFYCRASALIVGTGSLRAIELITQAMQATTEGEILELSRSHELEVSEEDYLTIITKKTAVLMAASCELGGVLGNVSEEFTAALRFYGENLGIAFQLADDTLDYVSDPDRFGKPRGTDLREGKLTLPLIVALRDAGPGETRLIKDALIAEQLEPGRLREIISIIEKYDGIGYTKKLARRYVEQAKRALASFKPSLDRDALTALGSYVIDRNS